MDCGTLYLVVLIASVGVLSWLIRALPFLLFGRSGEPPKVVSYVGRVLSPAAIAMLVVYCFAGYVRDRPPSENYWGAAEIVSAIVTISLQWKWKCPPVSIAVGTILYMVFVNL
ncbi:MAG: AzlD domain-containing protein [Kiritimatiellae bacterium]|nr:AzlD domain-containing protein [Kiritimatiellia bacterium]